MWHCRPLRVRLRQCGFLLKTVKFHPRHQFRCNAYAASFVSDWLVGGMIRDLARRKKRSPHYCRKKFQYDSDRPRSRITLRCITIDCIDHYTLLDRKNTVKTITLLADSNSQYLDTSCSDEFVSLMVCNGHMTLIFIFVISINMMI